MIKRYSREVMSSVWSEENKMKKWLDTEIAVVYAYMVKGIVPKKEYEKIARNAKFDVKRVNEIESKVKHDVIAFLTSVNESLGKESRFIHMGMTSSDMLDTANALILKESAELLIKMTEKLKKRVLAKADKFRYMPIVGRTHGVHAEPTSVGLKMLIWADDLERCERMFRAIVKDVARGKISGAVGNYANISPDIETIAMKKLKIERAKVSSQIVSRDVYADYLYALSRTGAVLEKIALQIRLLQRTETREFEEPFSKGQKGSSAMPHKRNPVICEQICGLARVLRSNLLSGLENIALWDERDISHSSVERIVLPDSSILLDYMLDKMIFVVDNMGIYEKNIKKNFKESFNLIFSQRVLLALIGKGMLREEAYSIVQANAMKAWKEGIDFKALVKKDSEVMKYVSLSEIEKMFDTEYYLKNIDKIFKRFRK